MELREGKSIASKVPGFARSSSVHSRALDFSSGPCIYQITLADMIHLVNGAYPDLSSTMRADMKAFDFVEFPHPISLPFL
jgi:hypothetical protein